ncbi:MAG: AAA family ATPase [Chloroflexota bacterium]|nr:AAA family ATPase [Chloroflexota bacterium]MDE2945529.1 AAA family ATPase [Chloroflexota bacterium]
MRITKISVKGLFGIFDHEIPLNQESRITIIHGPNGVGKTVLLRMVHGLFNYDYRFVGQIPFDYLKISFEGGASIGVQKIAGDSRVRIRSRREIQRIDAGQRLLVEFKSKDRSFENVPFMPSTSMNLNEGSIIDDELHKIVSSELPHLTLLPWANEYLWADFVEGLDDPNSELGFVTQVYSLTDILNSFPVIHERLYGVMPDWFAKIRKCAGLRLVQTERLMRTTVLNEYTGDIGQEPKTYDILRAFGRRYKEFLEENETEWEEFRAENPDLFQPLLNAIEEMMDISSIERSEAIGRLIEERPDMFEQLFEDIDKAKGSGFLSDERQLFEDILNERFLFKSISIEADKGLNIINEKNTTVDVSDLSSGEQHLLILYSQLLFETEPDTLVMIDEPELSMNVVWQRNFLKDLQRIIELRKFDVLIATHSPQIIHDKWDWVVHLGEKVDD